MNILGGLKYFFQGVSPAGWNWRHHILGGAGGYNYRRIGEEEIIRAFNGNDAVYSTINYLAANLSALPLTYWKGDKEVEAPDQYATFMQRPCAPRSRVDFLYRCATFLSLTGDLILLKEEAAVGFNDSKKLTPLYPQHVQIRYAGGRYDPYKVPERYDYSVGGVIKRYTPDQIIHLQYFDPEPYDGAAGKGLSPFQPGSWILRANNNLTVGESQILENRGASMLVSSKEASAPLNPNEIEALNGGIVTELGGARNMGAIKYLRSAVDIQELGMSSRDLELVKTYPTQLRRLCTLLNLPAELFNAQGSGQFNTRKEARKAAFSEAIIPMAEMIFAAIDDGLHTWGFDKNYHTKVDRDKIGALNPEPSELYDQYLNWYRDGAISREKFLELVDLEDEGIDLKSSGITINNPAPEAAPEKTTEEAGQAARQEAQFTLRGSVGGAQALLAIQASVIAGTTQYSAALVMLIELFGFEDAIARQILGDESKINQRIDETAAAAASAAAVGQSRPTGEVEEEIEE